MEDHEKRNPLPPLEERSIEVLIYGRFVEHEYDKGFYSTAWLLMDDVLAEIGKDTVAARLASYRDGLGRALDAALEAATAAAQKPAAGSPETG